MLHCTICSHALRNHQKYPINAFGLHLEMKWMDWKYLKSKMYKKRNYIHEIQGSQLSAIKRINKNIIQANNNKITVQIFFS